MAKKHTKTHKNHISAYLTDPEKAAMRIRMEQECFKCMAAYVRRLIILDSQQTKEE